MHKMCDTSQVPTVRHATTNFASTDLSDVMPEDMEHSVKEAAEVSMGTEVSKDDIENISDLCDQVTTIATYRTQLFDYLKNRMMAVAPNLTCIVGELVGARLIAHAGSLMSLAKHPASTVQILGAEKALFRALKTKHDTPKYGLIYHASLVGQAAPKFKGKISRVLAAKTSLSARMDALGETEGVTVGLEHRLKVENRLRMLEGGKPTKISGLGPSKAAAAATPAQPQRHEPARNVATYNESRDVVMESTGSADGGEKKKKKKKAKDAGEQAAPGAGVVPSAETPAKQKGKRYFEETSAQTPAEQGEKKKKKKKQKTEEQQSS